MRLLSVSFLAVVLVLSTSAGCGGSGSSSSTGLGSDVQTVTGTVFAPNGTDPIAGATVYIPSGMANLATPTSGLNAVTKVNVEATCSGSAVTCSAPASTALCSTCSCADGAYTLDVSGCSASSATTIKYQKGAMVASIPFSSACTTTSTTCAIIDTVSRFPTAAEAAADDEAEALNIAVVTGEWDDIQDVLAKLGYGTLDEDNHLEIGSESGITLYRGGDSDLDSDLAAVSETTYPEASSLFSDATTMQTYDIIFINCGASELVAATTVATENLPIPESAKRLSHAEYHAMRKSFAGKSELSFAIDSTVIANIQTYVNNGGKLYVTDWAYDFVEQAFPDFMDFEGGGDGDATTAETSDAAQVGDSEDANANNLVSNATINDATMKAWLSGRSSNTLDSDYAPSRGLCATTANGNTSSLNSDETVRIGDFLSSWSVMKEIHDSDTTVLVEGTVYYSSGSTATRPLTVSRSVGTNGGKILYSSYHSAHTCPTTGFWPQERILQYLVFETVE